MSQQMNLETLKQIIENLEHACIRIPSLKPDLLKKIKAEDAIVQLILKNQEAYYVSWKEMLAPEFVEGIGSSLKSWADRNKLSSPLKRKDFASHVETISEALLRLSICPIDEVNDFDVDLVRKQNRVWMRLPFFERTVMEQYLRLVLETVGNSGKRGRVIGGILDGAESILDVVCVTGKVKSSELFRQLLRTISSHTGFQILYRGDISIIPPVTAVDELALETDEGVNELPHLDEGQSQIDAEMLQNQIEEYRNLIETMDSDLSAYREQKTEEIKFIRMLHEKGLLTDLYRNKRTIIDRLLESGWVPRENWQRFFVNSVIVFSRILDNLKIEPLPKDVQEGETALWAGSLLSRRLRSTFGESDLPPENCLKVEIIRAGFCVGNIPLIAPVLRCSDGN